MKYKPELSENNLFLKHDVSPHLQICVVIPVKDEETHILKTLSAFLLQVNTDGNQIDFQNFEILILANNCTDRSVELIRIFQQQNLMLNICLEEIFLPPEKANIGYVRKILMETAFKRLSKNSSGIIMTTDGDTTVSSDWISKNQEEIKNGADAVGGRILLCPEEILDLNSETYTLHLKDEKYRLLISELEAFILRDSNDPSPRHHQHFNGSFAVTTDCYLKSGGLPDVTYLEDIAFFEKLKSIDAKIRHSHQVVVHTSARCVGRTEIGLSYQLNQWKNFGDCGSLLLVECCESIICRLKIKGQFMEIWQNRCLTELEFNSIIENIFPVKITVKPNYADFIANNYFGEWYIKAIEPVLEMFLNYQPSIIDDAILNLENALSIYSVSGFSQTSIR